MFLRPVHPGEILREEFMLPRKLMVSVLAKAAQIDELTFQSLVDEETSIDGDIASKLALYFGTSVAFWAHLQKVYMQRMR